MTKFVNCLPLTILPDYRSSLPFTKSDVLPLKSMGKLSMTMHASLQSNFRATASEVNRAFRLRLLGRDDARHLVKLRNFFFKITKKGQMVSHSLRHQQ